MPPESQMALSVIIAALGGSAVGIERQWSGHASGPATHFAGIRTFTLLGAIGGIAGALWTSGMVALSVVLLTGGVALAVAAYFAASRTDVDGTTETAAVLVLGAGTLSGIGFWKLGSGLAVATALLLVEKSRLHRLAGRLSEPGLRAALRFAVMALVILPLLPTGPYGPLGGIRPRELWAVVLFFSGLSFAGYVARSLAGPKGYVLAGLLGGLVSSTNVAFTFSRTSREDEASRPALALGVLTACTVMYFRVLAACAVLYAPLAGVLWRYLALPAAVGSAIAILGLRKSSDMAAASEAPRNPLGFAAALQLAALFQAMLMLVSVARGYWGAAGLFASAIILGLTDVDALTIAMVKAGQSGELVESAAKAVALGVLSNTLLKFAVVASLGKGQFRNWAGAGLIALALASGAALWLY